MEFIGKPQTLQAKFMHLTMGFLSKNATYKALLQDLNDIKDAIEAQENPIKVD